MNKNEIKKALYKEKPIANFSEIILSEMVLKEEEMVDTLDNFYPVIDFHNLETTDKAKFVHLRMGTAYYEAINEDSTLIGVPLNSTAIIKYVAETSLGEVEFNVPVGDIGEADFESNMDAKLLNRWIV